MVRQARLLGPRERPAVGAWRPRWPQRRL